MRRESHVLVQTNDLGFWEGSSQPKPKIERVFACGETDLHLHRYTAHSDHEIGCVKCSSVTGKQLFKALGADYALVKHKLGWLVTFKAEPFALLTFAGGWRGSDWTVRALAFDAPDGDHLQGTAPAHLIDPVDTIIDGEPRKYNKVVAAPKVKSKEMAAVMAARFYQAGVLMLESAVRQAAREQAAARVRSQEAWRAAEAEVDEQYKDVMDGLRSIRARGEAGELALSNSEVTALITAVVKLKRTAF